MKKSLLFILGLFFTISLYAQWGPQSKVLTDSVNSKILGTSRQFTIYLPASYDVDASKTYPVLYLLHGLGGNAHTWPHAGHVRDVADLQIANGESDEVIIISPDAGGTINGYFNVEGWAYEDFFFKEFLPEVEKKYRIKAEKKYRAVAGFSMGGGGATVYAQRHPDMFCAAFAMSALMNVPAVGAVPSQRKGDPIDLLNSSVIERAADKFVDNADEATKNALRTVAWYVDCGDDDFLFDRNIEFYQAMRRAYIPCQLRVRDGRHDFEYWHSSLYECLAFISRCFGK